MSEALSSSEIEDVLSSIRRLVSDDMRPVSRGPQGGPAPESEKLLLTPALRVVPAAAPTPEPPAIEDVLASVAAKVDQQGEDWESETGDLSLAPAEPMATEDWNLPAAADEAARHEEAAYEADLAARLAVQIITDEPEAEQALPLEEPVLTFVSHRHDPVAPWAQEEAPEAPFEEVGDEVIVEAANETPLPGWAQASDLAADEAPATDAWTAATVEPDRAWADEAEAEVLQELSGARPAPASASAAADGFDLSRGEAEEAELPINEDVLREIVRDVLREELQGRLGERITRNIRKLVRAEIARATATDEFL